MIPEQQTASQPIDFTPANNTVEHPLVFMGGIGYDEQRNREVGSAIVGLIGHRDIITISDSPRSESLGDDTVVHRHEDGLEYDLPGKLAIKLLDEDVTVRFSRLHERRARELIDAIERTGEGPVDAVFQSVDVSTGILAMHERPDLFKKVVLLDPSSVVKLPARLRYLKEEWQSRNLFKLLKRKKDLSEVTRFESKVGPLESYRRMKRSNSNGNKEASYVSSQAPLLHDVAQSENAPIVSIMTSLFDHAYTPERLLQALVSLDDISGFFVTNSRHGLGGKQEKLEQLASVLKGLENNDMVSTFMDKIHFFKGVSDEYRQKILEILKTRGEK